MNTSETSCPRTGESLALSLAAFMGPTLAVYAPLGMAPLFIVTGISALWFGRRRLEPLRPGPAAILLAAALAWMAAGLLWVLNLPQALRTLAGLSFMFVGGLLWLELARTFDDAERARVRSALVLGLGLASVLACLEALQVGPGSLTHPPISRFDNVYGQRIGRGLTVIVLLLGPGLAAAWWSGRAWAGVAILVAAAAGVIGGYTLSAGLALIAIPVVAVLCHRFPRGGAKLLAGGMILVVLAFPLLALVPPAQERMERMPLLPNSAHHRLTIWAFTATKALEHPLRGWGLEAARFVPGAEDTVEVVRRDRVPKRTLEQGKDYVSMTHQMLPLHPHSGPGQIWLELGGIGAVFLCGLLLALTRAVAGAADKVQAAMIAAAIGTGFLVSSVSYGIWQSWWLSSMWLCAIICVAVVPSDGRQAEKSTDAVPR